jgi:hypothetical protein
VLSNILATDGTLSVGDLKSLLKEGEAIKPMAYNPARQLRACLLPWDFQLLAESCHTDGFLMLFQCLKVIQLQRILATLHLETINP